MTDIPLEYTFESVNVCTKHKFEVLITEKLVSNFADISGDFNPIP